MKVRKAVIPAAGLGTRFLPATKAMPKEMVPIVDKPTIQFIVEEAKKSGLKEVDVKLKGIGPGKESAKKQIEVSGIAIKSVEDVTPIPHNGTRPPKRILKRQKRR